MKDIITMGYESENEAEAFRIEVAAVAFRVTYGDFLGGGKIEVGVNLFKNDLFAEELGAGEGVRCWPFERSTKGLESINCVESTSLRGDLISNFSHSFKSRTPI